MVSIKSKGWIFQNNQIQVSGEKYRMAYGGNGLQRGDGDRKKFSAIIVSYSVRIIHITCSNRNLLQMCELVKYVVNPMPCHTRGCSQLVPTQ